MKQRHEISKTKEEIQIEKLKNLMKIKDTIIKHNGGDYGLIPSNSFDLTNNRGLWISDDGVYLEEFENGISFYHNFPSITKGIILDYPLNNNFKLKFKLNYQIIVNFYLGTDHLINFRNHEKNRDYPLKTNIWHDMEFSRVEDIVSIKADGKLIKKISSNKSLFIIKVYNDNRKVNIKECYLTVEQMNKSNDNITENAPLENRISHLESYVSKLPTNINIQDLKNEITRQNRTVNKCIDSYNYLFNNIYLDYELKPKKLLNNIHLLTNELLNFVTNVCKKYNLLMWLDYGNLLGAVRHGDYVPWDDDADIGMIRKDYLKFEKIIEKEIEKHDLSDYVKLTYHGREIDNTLVNTFMTIRVYYKMKSSPHKTIISNVDIFPYDFINEYKEEGFDELCLNSRNNLHKNKLYKVNQEEYIKQYYEELNLNFDKTNFLIPGVDGACGINFVYDMFVLETNKVFPLKEIEFSNNIYPCPNDVHYYLDKIYGDYMSIPKIIHRHNSIMKFRYNKDNDEMFDKCISMLKNANKKF